MDPLLKRLGITSKDGIAQLRVSWGDEEAFQWTFDKVLQVRKRDGFPCQGLGESPKL